MSIQSVNATGASYYFEAQDHDGPSSSIEGELALLILNGQELQKHCERERREAARADYLEASRAEVTALHDEAEHIAEGAWLNAGLSFASGALGALDAAWEPPEGQVEKPYGELAGQTLAGLAQPLGRLLGESPAAADRADAKAAAGEVEQARWELSDAKDAVAGAGQAQERALDWLSQLRERDASTTSAVLSNLV